SVWQFLVAMVGPVRVVLASAVLAVKLARAALFGGDAADEAKEALFRRTLTGLSLEEIAPRSAAFGLAHYRRRARPEVRARLEWHRNQGHHVVLVSASPELYVRAVGRELGVDDVIATRLEVDPDGLLTGCYDGRNCRGTQKLARLEQWMRSSVVATEMGDGADAPRAGPDVRRPFLWAYGNSAGDIPLLSAADIGVDAGRLNRIGRLRRFIRLTDLEALRAEPTHQHQHQHQHHKRVV
ncbi:MAG: HAD-IB family phosphatase, partial [Acidimicrobiales bacterium]